jgi:hypothetical protein
MAIITSRAGLIAYCLRSLGDPVIQINVAPEQIEDRVDEALAKFWDFHGDGSQRTFLSHKLTSKEITNKSIVIPDEVLSVVRVLPFNNSISSFNLQYQAFMTELLAPALKGTTSNYLIAMEHLSTLQQIFNAEKGVRFNRITHLLTLDTDWSVLKVDDFIIIECFALIDPLDWTEIYNNQWIKEYTTALIKRQWGSNLSKYNGFQLPSGMTLDGATILQTALQEIEQLELELQTTWSLPLDFAVG